MNNLNVTIKLTNVSIRSERQLTEDQIRGLIMDRVMKAFSEEALTSGVMVTRFTAQADLDIDRELTFLGHAIEVLKSLSPDECKRSMDYLISRFGEK